MSARELVERLQKEAQVGKPLDWLAVRNEIHDESEKATAPQDHDILRAAFFAVMDLTERGGSVKPDGMDAFREARRKDHRLLIIREVLVGENVSTEDLYRVIQQEIAAGRMSADDELAKGAAAGMAAPHLTRAELVAQAEEKRTTQTAQNAPAKHGLFDWFRKK